MQEIDVELKAAFLEDADELIAEAEAAFLKLDSGDDSDETVGAIFRLAHSFKGSAKVVGFNDLAAIAHKLEDVLSQVRKRNLKADRQACTVIFATLDAIKAFVASVRGSEEVQPDFAPFAARLEALLAPQELCAVPAPPTVQPPKPERRTRSTARSEEHTIRVSTRRLDQVLNLVGEMVVHQSILSEHAARKALESDEACQARAYMYKLVREAQRVAMSLRLVPIKPLFQKLQRAARDVAILLGKNVEVVTVGEEAEIDKTVLEDVTDPLIHIVRNAVDHGIEPAEERARAGKRPQATVTLEAMQQDEHVVIKIADDGRGLDRARILEKAVSRRIVAAGANLTDREVYALIFAPGFSTKDDVTEISGRGVGLDIVERAVSSLKGSIDVQTKQGQGTAFVLSLPLSLSIVSGMVVLVDGRKYIIPVSQLEETIDLSRPRVETVTGTLRVINLRGEVIPILSLCSLLHGAPRSRAVAGRSEHGSGVVVLHHGRKVAFEVDDIAGQQQIVIKKLGNELGNLPGIVAGAVLSTGEPGLVLDLQELASKETHHATV